MVDNGPSSGTIVAVITGVFGVLSSIGLAFKALLARNDAITDVHIKHLDSQIATQYGQIKALEKRSDECEKDRKELRDAQDQLRLELQELSVTVKNGSGGSSAPK